MSIVEYVAQVVATAPPLNDDQAARIASMLRPYNK